MVSHPACNAGPDHNLHMPRAERVLLWAVRTWVIGRAQGVALDAAIDAAFVRLDAQDAADLLLDLMAALERAAVRPLTVECVCCRHATADEQRIVDVVALYQEGRDFEATRTLREIVAHPASLAARAGALRLALAFEDSGLMFVPRPIAAPTCETTAAPGRPTGASLH